jgi:hypothetical protein
MTEYDGKYFHRRWQQGFDGKPDNVESASKLSRISLTRKTISGSILFRQEIREPLKLRSVQH